MNVLPDGVSQISPEQKDKFLEDITFIRQYITSKLEGSEPFTEEDTFEVRNSQRVQLSDGVGFSCSSRQLLPRLSKSDGESYKEFHIYNTLTLSARWLYFNDEGTLDLVLEGDGDYDEELEGFSYEEAASNNKFQTTIREILEAIARANEPKIEYRRHDIPSTINTKQLSVEEITKDLQLLQENPLAQIPALLPKYRMTTPEGDEWLVSSTILIQSGLQGHRLYAALYRSDPEDQESLTPYIVYTSQSQGTWRLLPHVDKKGWHNKGQGGEESLNLPIVLQQTLWQFSAEQPQTISQPEVLAIINELTSRTYDVYLAGAEAETMEVADDDTTSQKLPVTTLDLLEEFSFYSPLYGGQVSASVVPSCDGSLRYLIFTEPKGAKWVGMVEPLGANMLDSFILDRVVRARWRLYSPPIEYSRDNQYVDNKVNAAGSIAVRALIGEV